MSKIPASSPTVSPAAAFHPYLRAGSLAHTSKQEGGNSRKTSRPEEKGGAKTRRCVARPAVLRSGGSLRQPPYGQTLPVCGRIAGPYRADSCTRHTSHATRPCLHSNQALPALQSGLIRTSIRPYLYFYQALPARLTKAHLDIRQRPAAGPAGASHPETGANDC